MNDRQDRSADGPDSGPGLSRRGEAVDGTPRLARIVVLAAAAAFTMMFFITALPRLAYPYDLDFIEDSLLMQSIRFADGQPVYIAPNADFNPHVYTPLLTWIGAMLIKVGGPSLPLVRGISLAATLVTTALIYTIASRESGERWLALACAGLYLGGYRINGFWYELFRVDPLFVALTVGGLALALYAGRSRVRLLTSAVVLGLTCLTKQTGFVVGVGVAAYLLITLGRRAGWFVLPFCALVLAPALILDQLTEGWYLYHTLQMSHADPYELSRGIRYVALELFGVMAGLSVLALLTATSAARRAGWRFWLSQPWLFAIALAVIVSGLGRIKVGGNLNNLMPAYALLCLAPALWERGASSVPIGTPAFKRGWDKWRHWALAGAVLIQFGLGVYNPPRYIPTPAMRQAGDRLIQRIAMLPGPVLVMMHPYYTLLAGKQPSTQIATLWYVRDRGKQPLPEDFVNRIESRYYTAIISDESLFETEPDIHALILAHYQPTETLDASEAPAAPTGVLVRPQLIYRPRGP